MGLKLYIAALFLSVITFLQASSQTVRDSIRRTTITQQIDSTVSISESSNYTNDDFSPGMLFFALVGIGLALICVGVGVAIVTVGLLLLFGLISFGVLSASLFVGLNRRSFSKGFKTFVFLSTGIVGLSFGIAGFYLINKVFELQLLNSTTFLLGTISGLAGGALLGYITIGVISSLTACLKQRFDYR